MNRQRKPRPRRRLSASGLFNTIRSFFQKISDPIQHRGASLCDHLMAGLAIFVLKYPSMLQFDDNMRNNTVEPQLIANLKKLFGIGHVPCDTAIRERIDEVDPEEFRPIFKRLFADVQRGKGLEGFAWLDGHYLLAIDGTEFFKSRTIHCKSCCSRKHRDGEVSYYHQMVGASLVNPENRVVLPFMPEMIRKEDGATKNDCEQNAVLRLLPSWRREHPHLKTIVLMDGLHSKAPQVRALGDLGLRYIVTAKQKDHKHLFAQLDDQSERHEVRSGEVVHQFRWRHGVELNKSNPDLKVNVLEYWEHIPERKVRKAGGKFRIVAAKVLHFAWITDLEITRERLIPLMRAGRTRWKVENETFNVLKNRGYNLGHNFGHGKKNLCTNMVLLMLLAFFTDMIRILCCRVTQRALDRVRWNRKSLSERMRSHFRCCKLTDWDDLMNRLAQPTERSPPG